MSPPNEPRTGEALIAARAAASSAHSLAGPSLVTVLHYLSEFAENAEPGERLTRTNEIALRVAEASALLESLADVLTYL